ncbi:unnamed protein product [Oncorhynchus mykiss]|uniref:EGF-like domain-containing protein n=1 Tax=Oncorhynchus mykiss TaxID=8022 RepID=A0A060VWW0_ONCMY|nr:unnamed protein product [Oncorhynchus mykiss]
MCVCSVCRQGCHQIHGSCSVPGECKCHYGYEGALCHRCMTFPGCVYGSCVEPWQCVCDVNWGGLLCDKGDFCVCLCPCSTGVGIKKSRPSIRRRSCFESACASVCFRPRVSEWVTLPQHCTNISPMLPSRAPVWEPPGAT